MLKSELCAEHACCMTCWSMVNKEWKTKISRITRVEMYLQWAEWVYYMSFAEPIYTIHKARWNSSLLHKQVYSTCLVLQLQYESLPRTTKRRTGGGDWDGLPGVWPERWAVSDTTIDQSVHHLFGLKFVFGCHIDVLLPSLVFFVFTKDEGSNCVGSEGVVGPYPGTVQRHWKPVLSLQCSSYQRQTFL